jgi:hypothetical protein
VTEWQREFNQFEQSNSLPQLELVRLPSDHTEGTVPGFLTPQAMVADNDQALGRIVDIVSHSKDWASTAIFVTEDDAQNGPDHVDSHRTTSLVISPYTSSGQRAEGTLYDSASMVRTIELILGLPPLSQFDAAAQPMWRAFSATPDVSPYAALPETFGPTVNSAQAAGAQLSAQMDFRYEDRAPMGQLNRVLWQAIKGTSAPYPGRLAGPMPDLSHYVWGAMDQSHLPPGHNLTIEIKPFHSR